MSSESLYERVGGREFFVGLVDTFYAAVAEQPLLREMYPEDLQPAATRLCAFLVQYFGGPPDYEALRGEPRLRMRHFEFGIDKAARDTWFACMAAAVASSGADPESAETLLSYFEATSTFLINRGGLALKGR